MSAIAHRIRAKDGTELHAEETGRGTPILFVHEFAGDHRTWEPQVRRFSRDGRFVRLLQPGRFTAFDPGHHLNVELVKVVRAEIAPEKALLLQKTHRPVAEQNFEIVHAGANEVARRVLSTDDWLDESLGFAGAE